MEFICLFLDVTAGVRLEDIVVENLGPGSPFVFAGKVFLEEIPNLECSD